MADTPPPRTVADALLESARRLHTASKHKRRRSHDDSVPGSDVHLSSFATLQTFMIPRQALAGSVRAWQRMERLAQFRTDGDDEHALCAMRALLNDCIDLLAVPCFWYYTELYDEYVHTLLIAPAPHERRVTVSMPAHREALGAYTEKLRGTLGSSRSQRAEWRRVWVALAWFVQSIACEPRSVSPPSKCKGDAPRCLRATLCDLCAVVRAYVCLLERLVPEHEGHRG